MSGDRNMKELKPCPSCGSERIGFDAFVEMNGAPAEGAITCTDCGASGSIISTLDIDSDLDNSDAGNAPDFCCGVDAKNQARIKELESSLKAVIYELESWNLTEGDAQSTKVLKTANEVLNKK
jgi:hypothetical protein